MRSFTLYYVHDPMCSWCYGFRPAFTELRKNLPDTVELKYLVGGLAPDSDDPMPEAMQRYLQKTWKRIQQKIPGVQFNFDFWTNCLPRRSTYPACRAVITASRQDTGSEEAMIEGIQNAYYQQARNPSDIETLADIAHQIGLDKERFVSDINSQVIEEELQHQIISSKAMGADSFPSLVLEIEGKYSPVSIDYNSADNILNSINDHLMGSKCHECESKVVSDH